MSYHLWRYFLEDDLENFQKFLANAGQRSNHAAKLQSGGAAARGSAAAIGGGGSAGGTSVKPHHHHHLSTSPTQTRKSQGAPSGRAVGKHNHALTRVELNARDHQGLTLLHWITSSLGKDALGFAQALMGQSLLDLAVQDAESAWTALHRALYFGNVTIARGLLARDIADVSSVGMHGSGAATGSLYKIKDREGNSPFDLYNASIAPRKLMTEDENSAYGSDSEDDLLSMASDGLVESQMMSSSARGLGGDELFMFGSNKNLNLGVGDQDDRQFPERILLRRPAHLSQRLRLEHMSHSLSRRNRVSGNHSVSESLDLSGDMPALVQFKAINIRDVQLSKLSTAVLTNDPESNLYMCGFGPGGRLGTGDESTRFTFQCICGGGLQGQKIVDVGLGQNHTLAITSEGEVFSWGSNGFGQLGYATASNRDEEPVQVLPRQIFGPLKRERAIGCAASRIHSVIYTTEGLYTFGKNEGQLGLVDSDARSLEMQMTPRAVAASLFQSPIVQVTAIDKATVCLLESHDVWVFANYGYTRVRFPLDDFTNFFLRSTYTTSRFGTEGPNHVSKICSGGDTICALAREGQVFTFTVSQSIEPVGKASTTNPVKIRNALSDPQKVWSLRKDSMACADVDVGQDGSIIICTKSGSVWRRTKRAKVKDANSKAKDYKFLRMPGLTRIKAVRSNAFGSCAAIRQDWDVLQTQVHAAASSLWQDTFDLFPFQNLAPVRRTGKIEVEVPEISRSDAAMIRRAVLESEDLESLLSGALPSEGYDLKIGSTTSDLRIPCHEVLLAARSSVMRQGFIILRDSYLFQVPDGPTIEYDDEGKPLVLFSDLDILTLFNLVLYLYTDSVVDVWHYTSHAPKMATKYKQVRIELMKAASALGMRELERATRLQLEPSKMLNRDLEQAYIAPGFFEHADVEIELNGTSFHAHQAVLVQRCPFFEGMFAGRSGGGWIKSRFETIQHEPEGVLSVDLKHIDPKIFDMVLRHIYADTGTELFDEAAAPDFESFLDVILDVMSVANELMLDRLAQTCQQVLGKFVNARNVCQLLNAVAPCSVNSFKRAALEYICLNLEIMLENHLLDELDDDLMIELDEVVRCNQDTNFHNTLRGRRTEEALLERHPDLAERLEFARKRKVDSMTLRARRLQREEEERVVLANRSPKLSEKASFQDLMFDMDEDGSKSPGSRPLQDRQRRQSRLGLQVTPPASPIQETPWLDARGKILTDTSPGRSYGSLGAMASPTEKLELPPPTTPSRNGVAPWASNPIQSDKLDMRQIMAQADERRQSNISAGLSGHGTPSPTARGTFKMSQKERKKYMQEQQKGQTEGETRVASTANGSKGKLSAWQTVSAGSKVSLKDVLAQPKDSIPSSTAPLRPELLQTPTLTTRQSMPGNATSRKPSMPQSPSTPPQPKPQPKPQQRSFSSPQVAGRPFASPSSTKVQTVPRPPSPKAAVATATQSRPTAPPTSSSSPVVPRSVRHAPSSVEPSLQLSMADILLQQQLEKDVIKEASASRSLQEIQEEQAFQEWWDAEEKATRERMQAAEQAATGAGRGARAGRSGRVGSGNDGGGGGGRGRGKGASRGRGRGRGAGRGGFSGGPVDAAQAGPAANASRRS